MKATALGVLAIFASVVWFVALPHVAGVVRLLGVIAVLFLALFAANVGVHDRAWNVRSIIGLVVGLAALVWTALVIYAAAFPRMC